MSETTTATSAGYDAAEEFLDRQSPIQKVQSVLHTYPWLSPAVVLVLAFLIFKILVGGNFGNPGDLGIMAQQTAIVGTLAIGQTLIILTAGIDLSCGAIAVLSTMVMAKTAFDQGVPGLPALLIGFVMGGAAGLLNGLLITRINLPPFIVTLGTLGIFTSITLLYATGRTVRNRELADELKWLGKPINLFGLTITSGVVVMVVLYLIFAYVLRFTAWGAHVYAVGDDAEAARLAGIQVNRVLLSVYVVAGFIFAIAAWISIGRVNAASPNGFVDANLDSITAVVIGGTSLFGGRGRVVGTLIGALIVTVVDHGLSVGGLDEAYKRMAIGILIIVAVAADQWIRRARA